MGTASDHAVCEVYVPDLGKWIVVDPDFNVAYRKGRVWLNAYELQQAWHELKATYGVEDLRQLSSPLGRTPPAVRQSIASRMGVKMVLLGPAGEDLRQSNLYNSSCTGMNLEFFEFVSYPLLTITGRALPARAPGPVRRTPAARECG